ncbi:peptide chain release factor 1 [Rhodospirillales bacterium]|nr:peptide chain release factor 1 [Rhodospirillales bacterium]
MSMDEHLSRVTDRFEELTHMMSDGSLAGDSYAELSKEYSDLTPIVKSIEAYQAALSELDGILSMMADPETDPEMKTLAEMELEELKERIPALESEVKLQMLPKDEADGRNALLEVRAGTGGDEAGLFAADLFRMYQRYSDRMGWKFEIMDMQETGIGGTKEAVAEISGKDVFRHLKFESGVHRVQRVPVTESGGRIHTSAATVAVMPEAEEVDVNIEDKDLRIDTYRAQGAGGQHVNTTDSAVRITHIPTGIVVTQQDEKSQHKNRAKAMKILRARMYDAERERQATERAQNRKDQVGSGDRSERIRTYNFPERRITDHRIGLTLHNLDNFLEGDMSDVIDALMTEENARQLAAME